MSSRRKRSSGLQADAFGQAPANLDEFADMLYSGGKIGDELRRVDQRSARIKNLPLDQIRPDPAQARRVMPATLRGEWLKAPDRIPEILEQWMEQANLEAERNGRPKIDVPQALQRDPDNTSVLEEPEELGLKDPGPIESSFLALVQLAASVYLHGLSNPITVAAQDDGTYLIETGERRLLAYNLLHSLPKHIEGEWGSVPARIVDERSIWRQAAENSARQDLNAISMARQLALLLMDIYKEQYSFARFAEMPGVEWYTQVYDSKKFPVPYGRGAELAAAMGLKSAAQIRQYRQLLSLPDIVWQLADELDWTEYKLREMMRQARSVTTVTDSGNKSVTTVTDSLIALARYEAGLDERLPIAFQPAKPSVERKTRSKVILRGVGATVTQADLATGRLTVQVNDPAALEALLEGEQILITVQRDESLSG